MEKYDLNLRKHQDQGIPDSVRYLRSSDEEFSFKQDADTFNLTVRQINEDSEKAGQGSEGRVVKVTAKGVTGDGVNSEISRQFAVKIKEIKENEPSYRGIYNEVILGKLKFDGFYGGAARTVQLADFRDRNYLYIVFEDAGMTLEKFSNLVHERYHHWPNFAICQMPG